MIEIRKLDVDRWQDYRELRLEALKTEPLAFSSSYEEELLFPEEKWRDRIANVLFALEDDVPIGMIVVAFNLNRKTNHIANIFGVFVKRDYREQHTGTQLMQEAIAWVQAHGGIVKIDLSVNVEQKAALKLYKKSGFEVIGRLKNDMRVDGNFYDELMMEKFL